MHTICMHIIWRVYVNYSGHTVETAVPASAVWRIWEDVANWNTWDHGIEFSTSNGPFQAE